MSHNKKKGINSNSNSNNNNSIGDNREIEWELRPGGMLVQKRDINGDQEASSGHVMIKISVSHASYHHHITVPSHCTFGNVLYFATQDQPFFLLLFSYKNFFSVFLMR